MEQFYDWFIETEVNTKRGILEDRKRMMSWGVDNRLPSFFQEKTHELKIMVLMGFDNFVYKSFIIYMEEIMVHMLIANELTNENDYIPLLEKYSSLFGHQMLSKLKDSDLIHEDDHKFCQRYFNDHKRGGERIRNIEIHNLYAEKIAKFELRPEVSEDMDDFGRTWLEQQIKSKPSFIHIGARDMVSRNIVNEMAGLHDLLNRNVDLLSKFNG